jgi:hypothetical protein
MGKDFHIEYDIFMDRIKSIDNFTITRWGDGEMKIINGEYINLLSKGNGEFIFDNKNDTHKFYSDELRKAFTHVDNNYFVGIACKCCIGNKGFQSMKVESKQPEENLTWANLFVNSNYRNTHTKLVPTLKDKKVVMVFNKRGNLNNIPFPVEKSFTVGTNAWIDDYNLIDDIIEYINTNNIKDRVFLIAAGPLANIMVYKLWMNNKENTYIDIGSVFDKELSLKLTRGYQLGAPTYNKKCIW